MSLGIAFKGPEGIVLAADSRVTLSSQITTPDGRTVVLPANFDHAEKLLAVKTQTHAGAITFGAGAIGANLPRTASSFLPELEVEMGTERLSVEMYARKLGQFFLGHWNDPANNMPAEPPLADNMFFLVGGYDEGTPYGRLYGLRIPGAPEPVEQNPGTAFGPAWGGQTEITDRLLQGFDNNLPATVKEAFNLNEGQYSPQAIRDALRLKSGLKIPWQFLSLQDCVDMSVFLIKTTIVLQQWLIGVRGVGGEVDVATITRVDGLKRVQMKRITGASS